MRTWWKLVGAAAGLALAAACGGGGSGEVSELVTTAEDLAEDAVADQDLAAFCSASADLAGTEFPDMADLQTDDAGQQALQEFYASMEPSLQRLEESAPAEVRDDVDAVVAAVREVAQTGDTAALGEAVSEASQRLGEFTSQNCPTPAP